MDMPQNTFFTLEQAASLARRTHAACRNIAMRTTQPLCFSHITALKLHGMAASMDLRPRFDENKLHVSVDQAGSLSHLRDVRFHLWSKDPSPVILDELVTCMPAADAICQMASYTDLTSLVIAMDWLTCRNPDMRMMSHAELAEHVQGLGRFPGVRLCRQALSYSREGTDSPQESLLRLSAEKYGIPKLTVNMPIMDYELDKAYVVDMALPEYDIVIEYDGRHHYTMERWEADLAKRNRLSALGKTTFVATKVTMANSHNLNAFLAMIAQEIGRRKNGG